MARLLILLLTTVCAGAAHAVDTANLSGSAPSNRRITYLYEIDFGATAQPWTLNINLATNATTGLAVSLIDVDALAASAQVTPTSIDSDAVTAPGTVNATLNGTYAGAHCFAIEIETAHGTTASDYNGALTTSVGTIAFIVQDQFVKSATGLKLAVGKFAFWDGTVPSGSLIAQSLELDFGASSHTEFFRFEGVGPNIQKIELIDTTGGSATILATFTNPTAGNITAVPITHSGKATLRINILAFTGTSASASWALNAPCSVNLSLVGDAGDGGSNDSKCSTDESTGSAMLVALLCLVMLSARSVRARP